MLARLGERLNKLFRASAPDPFVIAILLTAVTFALGLIATRASPADMVRAWQGGFWSLLTFAMQMCLILVTGHALASSPPVARAIRRLASLARSPRQAIVITSLVAMSAALLNWGFGLIVGAILAREITRELRRKGLHAPAGLLAAAGYTGLLVWHGGLSGSAPLKAAKLADQVEILGQALAEKVGAVPVSHTIFSPLNLVVTLGLLIIVPIILVLLCPAQPPDEPAPTPSPEPTPAPRTEPDAGRIPAMLERSPVVVWIICLPALAWLAYLFATKGLSALDLNTANMLFFALGLALHTSAHSYGLAVEDAAKGCAGIIVQFPLYAGIMGMITASGLGALLSNGFADAARGTNAGLSLATFASAAIVNLFVPSGGGQWAIQGPIGMQAAIDAGIDPAKIVMAISYGDELTNMLQPFWALPLLAITGVKAQSVVGYTAIVMLAAALWMALWLAVL